MSVRVEALETMKYRLAILNSHPIQYFTPLYRKLSAHPQIDLTVYYCNRQGLEEYVDPGFGTVVKWDIPLLEGYNYKFLPNWSWERRVGGFQSLINPSIITELWRGRYDAVLIHGYVYCTCWLGFFGAWVSRTPILMRGDSRLIGRLPKLKQSLKHLILARLFRRCDACLPIGRLNKDYYRHYGVPDAKLFTAPFSVDNEALAQAAERRAHQREQLFRELEIDPALPVILYASKMIPRKRADDLLQAYHRLEGEGVRATLLFIGDGAQKPELERYARDHRLEQVHFLGFRNQSEIPRFGAIADVFVLPAADEPWGLIINEMMCMGVPVVTTDEVGAAADLVRHGESGYVYPVGNIAALTDYLRNILTNPELRAAMSSRSREIINSWSYQECIRGYLDALCFVTGRD